MGEWGRKFGAFVLGLGISGSEPIAPTEGTPLQKPVEKFASPDEVTVVMPVGGEDEIEDLAQIQEHKDDETLDEEPHAEFLDIKKEIVKMFPHVLEILEGTLSDAYDGLKPNDEIIFYNSDGDLVFEKFRSAADKISPAQTEEIFRVHREDLDDGSGEYTFASGIKIPGKNESLQPLFYEQVNPTDEEIKKSIEKQVRVNELFQAAQLNIQPGNTPEQNKTAVISALEQVDAFIQYCDTLQPDGMPYVMLDQTAKAFLADKKNTYKELLTGIESQINRAQ